MTREKLFTNSELKSVSQFVARDVDPAIKQVTRAKLLPPNGTWIATSQTNAFIVAYVDKEKLHDFESFHSQFDTPFPALVSPDYRDDVLIRAYDGIYIFKDNVIKNEYALVVDFGSGVILENHYQRVEYISKDGQRKRIEFQIPLAFVLGVEGGESIVFLQKRFRRLTKTYLESRGSK